MQPNPVSSAWTILDVSSHWTILDAPPAAQAATATPPPPGRTFDLDDWKLQLPVDKHGGFKGSYVEVKDLDDYSSRWFHTGADGGMVLNAPVEGATTGGSAFARAELRETDGDARTSWTAATGGQMVVSMQVDEVPTYFNGQPAKICVGQIHDGTYQLARLYWDKGTLYWVSGRNEARSAETVQTLRNAAGETPSVGLNETFTYAFDVRGGEVMVSVLADGQVYWGCLAIGRGWSDEGFHFKAGVYLGSNEHTSTGSGQVSIYDIDVGHRGDGDAVPLVQPPPPPPVADPVISDAGVAAVLVGTDAADVFEVSRRATVVQAGDGHDTVRASVGWTLAPDQERLVLTGTDAIAGTGSAGGDAIVGNVAANRINGRGGDDALSGMDGDDLLYGDSGDDAVDGGAGDDGLFGGAGNDAMAAGAGGDTVQGGAGGDRLSGGAGADVFVWRSVNDSRSGQVDVLTDFESGTDLLDLGTIDANTRIAGRQAFEWGGVGAGHLQVRDGHLVVDVGGDGRIDLEIDLGGARIDAGDVLL